jgi:hypothetical protein
MKRRKLSLLFGGTARDRLKSRMQMSRSMRQLHWLKRKLIGYTRYEHERSVRRNRELAARPPLR